MFNVLLFIKENNFVNRIYRKVSYLFKIIPFYLVEERLIPDLELSLEPGLKNLTARILSPAEVAELGANPETLGPSNIFLEKLKHGYQCMGLLHRGQVVAYSWFSLERCEYKTFGFHLKENEAYLCDARTFKKYRGKNLAPYLRYQLYKELAHRGRSKFFSFTISGSTSSVRFKEKLGAKPFQLYLYVELLKKYGVVIPIKKMNLSL